MAGEIESHFPLEFGKCGRRARFRPSREHHITERGRGSGTEEDPNSKKNRQGQTPGAAHFYKSIREGAPPKDEPPFRKDQTEIGKKAYFQTKKIKKQNYSG